MKKYKKNIFATFHTIYRLATTSGNIKNFIIGTCRIYKKAFNADRVVMICKNVNSYAFMKIKLAEGEEAVKKGGISILSRKEIDIVNQ